MAHEEHEQPDPPPPPPLLPPAEKSLLSVWPISERILVDVMRRTTGWMRNSAYTTMSQTRMANLGRNHPLWTFKCQCTLGLKVSPGLREFFRQVKAGVI